MPRRTNAFYIQSPRLQNAFPVLISENHVVRMRAILPEVSVHVNSATVFGPDSLVSNRSPWGQARNLAAQLRFFGPMHNDASNDLPGHPRRR